MSPLEMMAAGEIPLKVITAVCRNCDAVTPKSAVDQDHLVECPACGASHVALHGTNDERCPPKRQRRPFEAPSEPLRSQDQDQDQGQDQDHDHEQDNAATFPLATDGNRA